MKVLFYILFLCLPFANLTVGGHIFVFELPLVLLLPFVLLHKGGAGNRLLGLDIVVAAYAFFSLLALVINLSELYESTRYYRINVLGPLLVYIAVRTISLDKNQLKTALLFFTPVALLQAAYTSGMFLVFGQRISGIETPDGTFTYLITMSLSFFLATAILLYLRNEMETRFGSIACRVLAFVAFCGLLFSLTRTTIVMSFILIPLGYYAWSSRKVRKLSSVGILAGLALIIAIIFVGGITYETVLYGEELREAQKTSERVFNLELYLQDLSGRFQFWSRMADMALDNPILGMGGASATIGRSGGTGFYLGNVHNFLLNELIVSGIVGLSLTFLQIFYVYRMLIRVDTADTLINAMAKIVWVGFTMIIAVGITGGHSGGRIFFYYLFMALTARVYLLSVASRPKPETLAVQKKPLFVSPRKNPVRVR